MSWAAIVRRGGLCLAVLCLVQGCGLVGENGKFRDRKHDYRKANNLTPLTVPPGLHAGEIDELYRVPAVTSGQQLPPPGIVPRPPALIAGSPEDLVKIQSVGSERWILVQLLPGQVWPLAKDFLLTRRIGVAYENGASGVIDTPWLQEPQRAKREAFRLEMRQGLQRSSAEVHVRQVQRTLDSALGERPPQPWPERSDDAKREELMLQRFASYLANTADVSASVSMAAQGIDAAQRIYLVPGSEPALRVALEPARAWASLGRALDKSQFEVVQQDALAGQYTVSPSASLEQKKPGRWKSFTGVFKRDKNADQLQYRVLLAPSGQRGWMQITVEAVEGELDPAGQEQVLSSIQTNIS